MSARDSFLGLNESHSVSQLDLVPERPEDLPIYLDKQFTVIIRNMNSIMSGGAFTPHSTIPDKLSDGNIFYFPFSISGTDITEGGLWQWNLTRYSDNLEIVDPVQPVWQLILPISKPTIARP